MTSKRILLGQGAGKLPPIVGLINGCPTSAYVYGLGWIMSIDGGRTWSASSSAILSPGSGWESVAIKDPCIVWDGSQYVIFWCGWNGSNFGIGRGTAPTLAALLAGTITRYGGNPIVGVPADGSYRQSGGTFPFVIYDPSSSPRWRMWFGASNAGVFSIGYMDSSDGVTWTDRGQVIAPGTSGDFDDTWAHVPSAIKIGSTWYVYYTGYRASTGFMHAGYATCSDPANPATYAKQGVLAGLSGNLTVGGYTWRSNAIRQVISRGGNYLVLGDAWNASGHTEESCWASIATSPSAIGAPSGLMIPINDGSWHANSAENPHVIFPA